MNFVVQGTSQTEQKQMEQLFKDTEKNYTKKLPHSVFMDIIATNPKHQNRRDLDYLNPSCEEIIKDCQVQFLQEHMDKKEQSIVNEDKTHAVFKKAYSYELLIEALKPIIAEKDPSLMLLQYFQDQVIENPHRQEYFAQKGLPESEAFSCALALSFYTGYAGYGTHTSNRTNRGASLCARTCNMEASSTHSKNYFPIMHYMIKALAFIPYHWGPCIRHVELTTEEQELYQVGSVVSWIQFTSSTTGSGVSHFAGRNTVLHIFSLSGRRIQPFSNFPDEKEVLFAPWSTFLVTKKTKKFGGKTHIYVRQVELGTSQNTIFWVDDKILDSDWENKVLMEYFTSQGPERNLRIIPKVSTKLALSFVDSPFGQYISKYITRDFQIVTDMNRPGEKNGKEAGAILIKELRERGFNHRFIVYTFDETKAEEALDKHAGHLLFGFENYAVISNQKDFLTSVGFASATSLTIKQFSQQPVEPLCQEIPAKSCNIF